MKRHFDPAKPYRYLRYARMSTDRQNPRSPEQQFDSIERTLTSCGYPWVHVADYRDDGVSGRYVRSRPGLQQMLRRIRDSRDVDLILVDTFNRFGRAEEVADIRRDLQTRDGVLVMTAESRFADPTSDAGKCLAFLDSTRATSENREKAHMVLRGKRDAAKEKHWPGGPPPFGYRLRSVLTERNGRQEVSHSVLEPDPETGWIIELFRVAYEKGWGCVRLANMLNDHPEIPKKFKPFSEQTVNLWLRQEVYTGTLVWFRNCTDVVDDRRVIERNPVPEDVLREADFCVPLVERQVFEEVRAMRLARSSGRRRGEVAQELVKQIAPTSRGLTLKHPLSGLVRCGHCRRAMTASSTAAYTKKAGEEKRYVAYVCPGSISGGCENKTRVQEEWLRLTVIETLLARLFGTGG